MNDAAGKLTVELKIAGLGDTVTTTVTASADATRALRLPEQRRNFPSDPLEAKGNEI